jgi:hypothetical protein
LETQHEDLFENFKKVKLNLDSANIQVEKFNISSKVLNGIIDNQLVHKAKEGTGFKKVPPPFNDNYNIMPEPTRFVSSISNSSCFDVHSSLKICDKSEVCLNDV